MLVRFLTLSIAFSLAAGASDWAGFRGPNSAGISPDRGLPDELGPDRNVAWEQKTPKGNSSPIVAGGRVWITGHEGDDRVVLCYRADNGSLIWRKSLRKSRADDPDPRCGPAAPTPATDGHSVFVFFPEIGLIAYGFDGKQRWLVPLGPFFSAANGMPVSPVYVDGKVVLFVDTQDEAYVVAYDASTGKQAWRTDRPTAFRGSHTTPVVYKPAGGPAQIIVSGAVELAAYQAKTGKRVWWANGVTIEPIANPVVAGDSVYTVEPAERTSPHALFSNYLKMFDKNKNGTIKLTEVDDPAWRRLLTAIDKTGNNDGVVTEDEVVHAYGDDPNVPGGGLVCTRLNGLGDVTKTNVEWRYTKAMPWVTAPLVYNTIVYVIRNGGILSTFDPQSGRLLRQERIKDALGDYMSQLVAGDGKIYIINNEGKVTVIRAGADWEKLSSGDLNEQVFATPAIAGGRIYIRTAGRLICFAAKNNK
jgi:outer membrane protein assembly factor BamB